MQHYSEDHIWVRVLDQTATLGLSRHATAELGELTFVELPNPGARFARGDVFCVVESVKTAADLCCPIRGTVCAVNRLLENQPALLNSSPEDDGWVCRLTDVDPADILHLLTPEQYEALQV
jgi:glycine cleavage system H protein